MRLHTTALARRLTALIVGAAALTALATPAYADNLGILRQSQNAADDLQSQLSIDLSFSTASGTTTAHFRFFNDVGTTSSLTHIYFRDDLDSYLDFTTAGISDSGTGVAFTTSNVSPTDPPSGAGAFGSSWTSTFALEAVSNRTSSIANGVNASGEWVQVDVDLLSSATETDVFEAFRTYLAPNSQAALRLENIGGSSSTEDWYFVQVVPEPGTLALMALGLGGLLYVRRRRRFPVAEDPNAEN